MSFLIKPPATSPTMPTPVSTTTHARHATTSAAAFGRCCVQQHQWCVPQPPSRIHQRITSCCAAKKKTSAGTDPEDPRSLHPNVIGLEDLEGLKDLKISADKFADDLARRVDAGELGEDRLLKDYSLLSEEVETLANTVMEGLGGTSIYLVGMMGSGKSTVGKLLASILKYCYFDTDGLIEQASNKTIAQMFEEDGEQDFRDAETKVLQELQPYKELIVATGGGVVLRAENWGAMQHGIVVRLEANTELLAKRVVAQGKGSRPLLTDDGQQAGDEVAATRARLDDILASREHLYGNADISVSVEGQASDPYGAPTAVVVYRILKGIDERIQSAEQEREEKKNFSIEGLDAAPASMKVVDQPVGGLTLGENGEVGPH